MGLDTAEIHRIKLQKYHVRGQYVSKVSSSERYDHDQHLSLTWRIWRRRPISVTVPERCSRSIQMSILPSEDDVCNHTSAYLDMMGKEVRISKLAASDQFANKMKGLRHPRGADAN